MSRFKRKPAGISGGSYLSSNGLARLAGVAALAVGGVGSIVVASGTAYASTTPLTVTSNAYTVGTGAVTGFSVAPGSNYVVSFKATDGVSSTSSATAPGTVSVSLPGTTITNGTSAFASGVSALVSVNGSQVGFATFSSTSSSDQVTVTLPTVVSSGDTVQIEFLGVSNPPETSATLETGTISTSSDPLTVVANYTIPASSPGFGVTASNYALGVSNVTYNVGPIDVPASGSSSLGTGLGASSSAPFSLTFAPPVSTDQSVTLPGAKGQYTVSVTNSSGTTSTDTVTGVTVEPTTAGNAGNAVANMVLTTPLVSGDTVNVTITGVINPPTSSPVTVTDSANLSDSTAVSYGTEIGSLTASLVPPTTSNTGSTTANLVAGFVSTSAIPSSGGGAAITLPSAITTSSSAFETTAAVTVGSGSSATTYAEPITVTAATATTPEVLSVAMPSVNAGQQVTVTVFGVKAAGLPGSNSYQVSVSTSVDTLPASATATEDFTVTPSGIPVLLSNSAVSATSNYTISGLEATAAIPADTNSPSGAAPSFGTSTGNYELEVQFPSGTGLPTSASDYTITDSTSSSGSGQVTGVDVQTSTSTVFLTVSNTIAQGDQFSVTVDGAINPSAASSTYKATITGSVEAVPATTVATVPTAASTYPNGALIQSGGQIDVLAGGYAFGIPTYADFTTIKKTDMSSVVSGSFPAAAMPAPGTLIHPIGTSGIWVVGTNGEIYQFSSVTQFRTDGYVFGQVVPVPSTGGLVAANSAPPSAAATMANGALVQYGTTVYEYVGGVATGIASESQLTAIQKITGAMVVTGTGSPMLAGPGANGTLIHSLGTSGVWVSQSGNIYQFSTATQFTGDGYSFQYVLPVAMLGAYTPGTLS